MRGSEASPGFDAFEDELEVARPALLEAVALRSRNVFRILVDHGIARRGDEVEVRRCGPVRRAPATSAGFTLRCSSRGLRSGRPVRARRGAGADAGEAAPPSARRSMRAGLNLSTEARGPRASAKPLNNREGAIPLTVPQMSCRAERDLLDLGVRRASG